MNDFDNEEECFSLCGEEKEDYARDGNIINRLVGSMEIVL